MGIHLGELDLVEPYRTYNIDRYLGRFGGVDNSNVDRRFESKRSLGV